MDAPDLSTRPDALRVVKHATPVPVEFAAAAGICQTLEGPVSYHVGDAILTGVKGERWPVVRAHFDASYAPAGQGGLYVKRPSVAFALRLKAPMEVIVGWRPDALNAKPGDWLLSYADGEHGVVRDDIFRETYGPAPGESRWPPP